jgi:hypothetical protein
VGGGAIVCLLLLFNPPASFAEAYTGLINLLPDGFILPSLGVVNIIYGDYKSVELGAINIVESSLSGIQGGLINIVGENTEGAQIGLLFNSNSKDMTGGQIGAVNTNGGSFSGIQLGLVNKNSGYFSGVQAGGINFTGDRGMEGTQIGIINVANRDLSGIQLGLFNYAESADNGAPIGLLSVVSDGGYFAIEAAFSNLTADIRMISGLDYLYSSLSIGASIPEALISVSFGLGSMIYLSRNFSGDFVCLIPELRFTIPLAAIELKPTDCYYYSFVFPFSFSAATKIGFALSEKFLVSAGPTFGIYNDYEYIPANFPPAAMHTIGNNQLVFGFEASLRYILSN